MSAIPSALPLAFVTRRPDPYVVSVVCSYCGKQHQHKHHRRFGVIDLGQHRAPCRKGDYLVINAWMIAWSDDLIVNLFAEVDALVSDFDPGALTFWDDAQLTFRGSQKSMLPDLTKDEWLALFGVWRQKQQSLLDERSARRQERLLRLARSIEALTALPRPRTAEENQQLYDLSIQAADLVALRDGLAGLATWG